MPHSAPKIDYRFRSVVETTPPSEEPVTLSEVKDHLRILDTETNHDTRLTTLIVEAREAAESYMDRSLITRNWTASLDRFPGGGSRLGLAFEGVRQGHLGTELGLLGGERPFVRLRKGQLTAVVSVTTFDDDDVGTVFAASNYFVDTSTEPGRVVLREGSSWPIPTRVANGIEILYTAGFADAASVPRDIVHGLLIHIAALWEHTGRDLTQKPDVSVVRAWYDPHLVGGRDFL